MNIDTGKREKSKDFKQGLVNDNLSLFISGNKGSHH